MISVNIYKLLFVKLKVSNEKFVNFKDSDLKLKQQTQLRISE